MAISRERTDATGLARIAHEPRTGEETFRRLAEGAPLAFFRLDTDGTLSYASPRWCELAGVSVEDGVGTRWDCAVPAEDRGQLEAAWRGFVGTEAEMLELPELRFVRPDGSHTWLRGSILASKTSTGAVTGYVGALIDVTAQRRAEHASAGRDHALRQLARGAGLDAVLTLLANTAEELFPDQRCSILLLDEATRRLHYGVAPRLPDFYVNAISGTEIGPGVGSCGAAAHRGCRVIVENVAEHPNWVGYRDVAAEAGIRACWSEPILAASGEPLGTLAMYQSVPRAPTADELEFIAASAQIAAIAVERTRSDERLRESERRFRAVFNQRTELAGFVTPDGIVTDANRRSLRMVGAERADVIGRPVWDTPWWSHDPSLQAELRDAVRRAAAGEFVRFEARHPRPDGKLASVDFSLTPIADGAGAVQTLFAEGVDITEQRRAQRRARESEKRAHEAEKLASIATLTAGIAHDVGAPMTAIRGYAEMIEKSAPDEKNRARAATIVEQVGRITQLVQALLNMARPTARAHTVVNLASIAGTSLDLYRELFRRRGIRVESALDLAPSVSGDPDRLQQALLNLLLNAADAMPEGGTLRVSLDSPASAVAEVRVEDTGLGIAPTDLARVFEPFYTTKERGQGTGLGLVVAKSIVDEHEGTIEVSSEVGRGTTVTIQIPAAG